MHMDMRETSPYMLSPIRFGQHIALKLNSVANDGWQDRSNIVVDGEWEIRGEKNWDSGILSRMAGQVRYCGGWGVGE